MNLDFSKKPFVLLIFPVIVGILLGKLFSLENTAFWIGCLWLVLAVISFTNKYFQRYSNLFLLAALTFFVAERWNVLHTYNTNYIAFQDVSKITSITGLVVEAKYKKDERNKYIIDVTEAFSDSLKIQTDGKVLLNTYKIGQRFKYGDKLHVKCRLQKPKGKRNPGQFDYQKYLANEDIHLVGYINRSDSIEVLQKKAGNLFVQWIVEPARNYFKQTIESSVADNNESILMALLLGERQDVDDELLDQFKNVGVVHVLAISGLHVGFIIIFVMSFLSFFRLKYNNQIYILLIILFVYAAVINFKAPVMRASLMAAIYFLAKLSERKISLFNIIFCVAFFLLLIDPRDLFNPGFQFSFVAVLSIVYGYPKLNKMIPLKSKINFKKYRMIKKFFITFFWDAFLVSLAAVLGTLPLTINYYGVIPTYALIANIFVIPIIGIVVILGLMLLVFGLISEVLAISLGNLVDLIFSILKNIIIYFYNLPYSHLYISMPSVFMILLMFLFVYFLFNINHKRYRILFLGTAILILFTSIPKQQHQNKLQVTFLDVGQGDASFVKFPNGESMIIDGGDASKDWDQGKNAILPFLKYNDIYSIKYAVASHPHNDHIGGLIEILKIVNVDTLIISDYKYNTKKYQEMLTTANNNDIQIRYVSRGDMLYPDSSCRVYILHPSDEFTASHDYSGEECNNSSIVMKIQYGENGILFTGDSEKEAEQAYTKYGEFLESEIVKMGHHGSKTSSSQEMLNFVNPLAAVISVAERNKFRHPSPITMFKLEHKNIQPFLTSDNGAIQFDIYPSDLHLINWNKNNVKLF